MNYSNFGKRSIALVVDVLILSFLNNFLRFVFDLSWSDIIFYDSDESNFKISFPLLFVILQVIYFGLFECSRFQATPGKMLLKIIVTDENGARIGLAKSILRNTARIVSTLTLFIGYIMFFFSEENQCLHDRLASTVVLDKPFNELSEQEKDFR